MSLRCYLPGEANRSNTVITYGSLGNTPAATARVGTPRGPHPPSTRLQAACCGGDTMANTDWLPDDPWDMSTQMNTDVCTRGKGAVPPPHHFCGVFYLRLLHVQP